MRKLLMVSLTTSLIVSLTVFQTLPLAAGTASYVPGVHPGDFVLYQISTSWYSNIPGVTEPDLIKVLDGASTMRLLITSITGTLVTATESWTFSNGTLPRTDTVTGDLAARNQLAEFVIAGGLNAGDPIAPVPYSPTINATHTRNYAGVERVVNVFNFTFASSNIVNTYLALIWEKNTGLAMQQKYYISSSVLTFYETGSANVKASQTSIPSTSPDFKITTSPTTLTGQNGTSVSLTITLTSLNGFIDTLTLTATTPGASTNFNKPTLSLNPDQPATATLNITINHTTAAGRYTLHISATNGETAHTADEPLTVSTTTPSKAPTLLGLPPTTLYAVLATIAAIIVIGAALALRRRARPETPPATPAEQPTQAPPPPEPPTTGQPPEQGAAPRR